MRGILREKKPGGWELRIRTGRDPVTGEHHRRDFSATTLVADEDFTGTWT